MSLIGIAAPPISPRVAKMRPSVVLIWMVGGRLGISNDWIGGKWNATQANVPAAAITAQIASTMPQ